MLKGMFSFGKKEFSEKTIDTTTVEHKRQTDTSPMQENVTKALTDAGFLNAILDLTVESIIVVDDAGTISKASKQARSIFGFSADELVSHNVGDFLETGTQGKNILDTLQRRGLAFGVIKVKRQDNVMRTVEYTAKANIEPHHHLIILRDTFEKALAASKVAESQEYYKTLLSSIGEGMFATDAKRNIVFMNKAAEELLGWKIDDVLGKSISLFMHVLDEKGFEVPENDRPIHSAITGKKVSNVYYYFRRDGSKFLAKVTATPVMLDDKIIGTIEILLDVTKEKEVDKMKTEFISLASHQLRTPLSAMRWFCEMLLNGDAGKMSKEQREFVTNISNSNARMIELVNSLLNISRIESGRLIIDPRPTNISKLAKEVATELGEKLHDKNQNLIISVHENLPLVTLDPKLIRQVYLNLLTNAIKYSPKDTEISIFISKNNTDVISQVTDQGFGIPEKEQHKVFQKFFRAENIVKVETDGTGLGLYLVKAIIDSSGGKIWFKSIPDKGTTFWFSLPLSGMQAHKGEVSLDS